MKHKVLLTILLVPTVGFTQAMSLDQALKKSARDRSTAAADFHTDHVKATSEESLAQELVGTSKSSQKRGIASQKPAVVLEEDDSFDEELDETDLD